MPNQDDLSSLPSTTLRAALIAAEKREKREKEEKEKHAEKKKLQREIRDIRKRLNELEKEVDSSEAEPEGKAAARSQQPQRKEKRPRSESSSDDEVALGDRYKPDWPIAKARKVDPPGPSNQRCVYPRSLMKHPRQRRTCSPTCSRCLRLGVRCERDKTSGSRFSSCLACRRSKARCEAPSR